MSTTTSMSTTLRSEADKLKVKKKLADVRKMTACPACTCGKVKENADENARRAAAGQKNAHVRGPQSYCAKTCEQWSWIVREGSLNAVFGLKKSLMMDHTPKKSRGRWNAVDSLQSSVWAGTAAAGGFAAAAVLPARARRRCRRASSPRVPAPAPSPAPPRRRPTWYNALSRASLRDGVTKP